MRIREYKSKELVTKGGRNKADRFFSTYFYGYQPVKWEEMKKWSSNQLRLRSSWTLSSRNA